MVARGWVTPHAIEFEPQLREAFLTLESYLGELDNAIGRGGGIYWWDGNGDPNGVTISYARGGDFFIDRITGDIYRMVAEPYTRTSTAIAGENETRAYNEGSMWWDSTGDPTLLQPPQRTQDYWLNTTTADIWALR